MSGGLDLDDVAATSTRAAQELQALRDEVLILRTELQAARDIIQALRLRLDVVLLTVKRT